MNIAIIGGGISGLTAAYHLYAEHSVTMFEAASHLGGHSNTVTVERPEGSFAVDTGFIVYNDWTYPNFIRLLTEIGIEGQPTEMSFSVKDELNNLEYNGHTPDTLFAQRLNLIRPSFWRMLFDIMRFNKEARALLQENESEATLGDFLKAGNYSSEFCNQYIVPMGAAIWSTSTERMLDFPVRYFARFFENHGLLNLVKRPQWYTIPGGSKEYVKRLSAPFAQNIRLNTPVASVKRTPAFVEITTEAHGTERFDEVIFACHSNQALRILNDPTPAETEILGAIPYQANETILHQDISLMPKRPKAWASWNYHLADEQTGNVAVTYNMNILQQLKGPHFLVTLNRTNQIEPEQILHRVDYEHPVYTNSSVAAQQCHHEISGVNRTHYCGAYWRHGFHEDGVVSAMEMLKRMPLQKAA
jgi:predicted NAD/FAD-binding protein